MMMVYYQGTKLLYNLHMFRFTTVVTANCAVFFFSKHILDL